MKNFKELREKYRSKFPASLVAAAVKIALDMGGAMTPAVKKIEKMKKGLSDDPIVADALRQANESVNEAEQDNLQEISPETLDRYMKKSANTQSDIKKKRRAYKDLGDIGNSKKMDKKLKNRQKGYTAALIRHQGKTRGDIYLDPKSKVGKAIAKMPKSLLKKYGLDKVL